MTDLRWRIGARLIHLGSQLCRGHRHQDAVVRSSEAAQLRERIQLLEEVVWQLAEFVDWRRLFRNDLSKYRLVNGLTHTGKRHDEYDIEYLEERYRGIMTDRDLDQATRLRRAVDLVRSTDTFFKDTPDADLKERAVLLKQRIATDIFDVPAENAARIRIADGGSA